MNELKGCLQNSPGYTGSVNNDMTAVINTLAPSLGEEGTKTIED